MKRIIAFLLSISMIFAMSACDNALTKEAAVKKALKGLKKTKSVSCEASVIIDLVEDGEQWYSVLNTTTDTDFKNNTFHSNINVDSTNEQMEMEVYANTGKKPAYYVNNGSLWVKLSSMDGSTFTGTTPYADFEQYFNLLLESEEAKLTETWLDGEAFYELVAPITVTSIDPIKLFGLDAVLAPFAGADGKYSEDVFAALGNLTLSVFFYKDTLLPYGVMFDMTRGVQSLYSAANIQATINDISAIAIYTNYNEVEKTIIPDEALNAISLATGASSSVTSVDDADPTIVQHMQQNGAAMISSFDASFSNSTGRPCNSTITVTKDGFILNCVITGVYDVPEATKKQLQASYNGAAESFKAMFIPLQEEVPAIKKVLVNIRDQNNVILASIDVNLD